MNPVSKRILFIDIDGVFVTQDYGMKLHNAGVRQPMRVFDPLTVKRLDDIIDSTECDVVVSSTWRIGRTIEDLQNLFLGSGLGKSKKIIGKTDMIESRNRGREIKNWLKENTEWNNTMRWAVLDDGYVDVNDHLFQTSFDTGLTDSIRDQVIDYLLKDE